MVARAGCATSWAHPVAEAATPCAFDACEDAAARRVVVTAGQAASWALRPALLEQVDADRASEGDTHGIGFWFCEAHAAGIAREQYQARAARLSAAEQRVLAYLQSQALAGGATVEAIAGKLRVAESSVSKMIRHMRGMSVIAKSRYRGLNRAHRNVDKFIAVAESHEPPAVQPRMGLSE